MGEGDNPKSLAEHLMQVEQQTGHTPEELEGPPIPLKLDYLWGWFLELHGSRTTGAVSPDPITYTEIKAWAELKKTQPNVWEVELIRKLDNLYLEGAQNGFSKAEHRD